MGSTLVVMVVVWWEEVLRRIEKEVQVNIRGISMWLTQPTQARVNPSSDAEN